MGAEKKDVLLILCIISVRQVSSRGGQLSCMSACKIFLAVELLLWIQVLCSRTATRNQLNCRGSRPHSRMTHHEGFVSLTRILLSIVTSYFC